jgi:FdhD protein
MEVADVASAVVQELALHAEPISSARLCKVLGIRMSTLLRALAYLGEAEIAGQAGLGWVRQEQDGERLMLSLAPAPPSLPAPTQQHAVLRYRDAAAQAAQDALAEETPVALVYNGISHAVMMATPNDLEAFALGFSLSEGIVDSPAQIYGLVVQAQPQGVELHIEMASAQFASLKDRRRQLAGRTGCGLCGLESLQALDLDVAPLEHAVHLRHSAILAALQTLPQHQPLNAQTGALHVAAWVNAQGQLPYAMEDVGRHNALDKLVGTLAHDNVDPATGWVLMSSRASYELVQKCARARISLLATVSAPTAMAVRLAQQAGICLVGFVRASGLVVYSFPERVLPD